MATKIVPKPGNIPEKVECESINHINVSSSAISMHIKELRSELTQIKSMLKDLTTNVGYLKLANCSVEAEHIHSDHFESAPILPLEIDSTLTEFTDNELENQSEDFSGGPSPHPDERATIREKIRFYLVDSMGKIGFYLDLFILSLILWSLIMFILSTEDIEVPEIEIFLTIVFAIEYTFRCYASWSPLGYMFSFHGIIDVVSFLPSLVALIQGSDFNLSFLRAFRCLRAFRIFRYTIVGGKSQVGENVPILNGMFTLNSLHIQIYRSAFTTSVIILVISGLMFFAEGPDSDLEVPTVENFFEALYFTIVAISTVGFGEISPGGVGGQLIMTFSIPICIIMLPLQASLIGDAYEKFQNKMDAKEIERRSSFTLQDLVRESRNVGGKCNTWARKCVGVCHGKRGNKTSLDFES